MRLLRIALALAAVPLGVAGYRLLHDDLHQTVLRSLPSVAIGWTAIAAGLIAWSRRPSNRMGMLMTAFGFAVLVRTWQYSTEPLIFVLGFALGGLAYALYGHVALAYPAGRVSGRSERLLVWVGYGAAVAFPLGILLVAGERAGLKYAPLAPESPLLVATNNELARALERAYVIVFFGVLTAWLVVLLVRKFVSGDASSTRGSWRRCSWRWPPCRCARSTSSSRCSSAPSHRLRTGSTGGRSSA